MIVVVAASASVAVFGTVAHIVAVVATVDIVAAVVVAVAVFKTGSVVEVCLLVRTLLGIDFWKLRNFYWFIDSLGRFVKDIFVLFLKKK